MQRVWWTLDLIEAHIVAGLLRERGIAAFVFDDGMVRQDWFRAIAIGGYRVMVASEDVGEALGIVAQYGESAHDATYADGDMPACPRCAENAVVDDPRPRRAVFLALIVLDFGGGAMVLSALLRPSQPILASALAACLVLGLFFRVPGVLGYIVKHRYRCRSCGYAFRDGRGPSFGDLAAAANAGDRRSPAPPEPATD